ncbi:ribosomal L7Ae/L30e/S12e/Gadd45 family protein [Alkalibacter mobilis]|uniref:ribosomal L7Ae/L30e/S12e/Gadd45 family protein n=1 Tax=Alkalibacter mobilis TaxID=2787712 RepID=UPI00189D672F|nr:ribosomal L7Ae/L30e/S12e/Gadd45 family protein [Alkalibacter mobilis]MBF7095998.1 ribosomal L7Ae/L30e/S12e/Gadd45 family protein [Alkalibacter mobilis]
MLEELQTGNVVVGTRQTIKMIKSDNVSLVYLSKDADQHIIDEVESACKNHKIEVHYVNSMVELGNACGIKRKTATAAILKG